MRARTLTLVFTDLVGSTGLKARIGDAAAGALIRQHKATVRALLDRHRGREIDNAGDGFFMTFERPSDAIWFALDLQLAHRREPQLPAVRIGGHIGEVREHEPEEGTKALDVEGLNVDLAARIQGLCEPGQILVSAALGHAAQPDVSTRSPAGEEALEQDPKKAAGQQAEQEVVWLSHAGYRFKGFEDTPLEIMEAGLVGVSPLSAPKGSDKARRADRGRVRELPIPMTRMFGRDKEVAELRRVLEGARLLTLLGPGGAGKSRLGLHLADALEHRFQDGAAFVELAALDDGALIAQAVGAALEVPVVEGRSSEMALTAALRDAELLLVLDNCEHLIDDAARFVDRLLRAAPEVRVVATSREGLGVAGETAWRVPPIDLQDAVALFVDRARSAAPAFELASSERPAVEQICRRLDGIPLAIELAAARVNVLSIARIQERLDDRFRLLGAGSRTAMVRQQTLRALVDWSFELLQDEEQQVLCRLAVFAPAGFSLAAAEHVCRPSHDDVEFDVLGIMARLVDKSLVTVVDTGDGAAPPLPIVGDDPRLRAGEAVGLRRGGARALAPRRAPRAAGQRR